MRQKSMKASLISHRRARSLNDLIEINEPSQLTVDSDNNLTEEVDESMCRVEVGEADLAYENPYENDEKSTAVKYSYAPKCLVLLSRVHDFRILKVNFESFYPHTWSH